MNNVATGLPTTERRWPRRLALGLGLALVVGVAVAWLAWRTGAPATVLNVQVPTGELRLGDAFPVDLRLRVPWRQQWRKPVVAWPEGLQVLKEGGVLRGLGWGTRTVVYRLTLQAYQLGPFAPTPVEVPLAERGGDRTVPELKATIPAITITPRLGPQDQPELATAGELPVQYLRRPGRWWPWLAGAAAVVILLVAGLLVWWRRRPRFVPPPPKPWAVAQEALQRLREQLPLPAERVYVMLTDIVRQYLEAAYQLPAPERTTPEFLRELERQGDRLPAAARTQLRDFLRHADLVKFAGVQPSEQEVLAAVEEARKFVAETAAERRRAEAAAAGPAPAAPVAPRPQETPA